MKASAPKKHEKSTFEKYINQAREEVATWPEWKIKNTMLCFSEYQRKQEEKHEKESKNNIKK